MNLEQLERAEAWVEREMRSLQPHVLIAIMVFFPASDSLAVRLTFGSRSV